MDTERGARPSNAIGACRLSDWVEVAVGGWLALSAMAGSVWSVSGSGCVVGLNVVRATMYVPVSKLGSCHAQNGGEGMVTCCPVVRGM